MAELEQGILDTLTLSDLFAKLLVVGRQLSDTVAMSDGVNMVQTLGGTAKDVIAVVDTIGVEILKIGADALATTDSLRTTAWQVRTASDAVVVDDSVVTGSLVFVFYGVDASVGPITMCALDDAGPLSVSGGRELSVGPIGFVTSAGDFVAVTDQVIVDSVEATE